MRADHACGACCAVARVLLLHPPVPPAAPLARGASAGSPPPAPRHPACWHPGVHTARPPDVLLRRVGGGEHAEDVAVAAHAHGDHRSRVGGVRAGAHAAGGHAIGKQLDIKHVPSGGAGGGGSVCAMPTNTVLTLRRLTLPARVYRVRVRTRGAAAQPCCRIPADRTRRWRGPTGGRPWRRQPPTQHSHPNGTEPVTRSLTSAAVGCVPLSSRRGRTTVRFSWAAMSTPARRKQAGGVDTRHASGCRATASGRRRRCAAAHARLPAASSGEQTHPRPWQPQARHSPDNTATRWFANPLQTWKDRVGSPARVPPAAVPGSASSPASSSCRPACASAPEPADRRRVASWCSFASCASTCSCAATSAYRAPRRDPTAKAAALAARKIAIAASRRGAPPSTAYWPSLRGLRRGCLLLSSSGGGGTCTAASAAATAAASAEAAAGRSAILNGDSALFALWSWPHRHATLEGQPSRCAAASRQPAAPVHMSPVLWVSAVSLPRLQCSLPKQQQERAAGTARATVRRTWLKRCQLPEALASSTSPLRAASGERGPNHIHHQYHSHLFVWATVRSGGPPPFLAFSVPVPVRVPPALIKPVAVLFPATPAHSSTGPTLTPGSPFFERAAASHKVKRFRASGKRRRVPDVCAQGRRHRHCRRRAGKAQQPRPAHGAK